MWERRVKSTGGGFGLGVDTSSLETERAEREDKATTGMGC